MCYVDDFNLCQDSEDKENKNSGIFFLNLCHVIVVGGGGRGSYPHARLFAISDPIVHFSFDYKEL